MLESSRNDPRLRIEQQYTKQEILLLYLNQIYFGAAPMGVNGGADYFSNAQSWTSRNARSSRTSRPHQNVPFNAPLNTWKTPYVLNRM